MKLIKLVSLFYFFIVLSFFSCMKSDNKMKMMNSGFINESGLYRIKSVDNVFRNIIVKEFKDGTLIFAIRNSKNEIMYQQNLNERFSLYHYWSLYIDENSNVWCYNSDVGATNVLLFDKNRNKYVLKDYCDSKMNLPLKFKNEIKTKVADERCISFGS